MTGVIYATILKVFSMLTVLIVSSALNCDYSENRLNSKFYLIKVFHRSLADKLHMDNVDSLESCVEMAKFYKGLALNYSPRKKYSRKGMIINPKTSRDHYWQQPQLYFNCHILQCPENHTFKSLVKDNSFDYYSLYESAIAIPNYICVSEVGLFVFHTSTTETFQNATQHCHNYCSDGLQHCGELAHIASASRTTSLMHIMNEYNQKQTELILKPKINLAYVGLYFNRTRTQRFRMFNMNADSLECFGYRAWEPGNPKMASQFKNTSCVALTSRGTWLTVDCKRKLPYFCEILTKCEGDADDD